MLKVILLWKIKTINYLSDGRRYIVNCVKQVFEQSFDHADHIEALEVWLDTVKMCEECRRGRWEVAQGVGGNTTEGSEWIWSFSPQISPWKWPCCLHSHALISTINKVLILSCSAFRLTQTGGERPADRALCGGHNYHCLLIVSIHKILTIAEHTQCLQRLDERKCHYCMFVMDRCFGNGTWDSDRFWLRWILMWGPNPSIQL